MKSLSATLVALLTLAGCTLDLVDTPGTHTRFFAHLTVRPDGGEDRFTLVASLSPGISGEGRRAVPDPRLVVGSTGFLPDTVAPGDPPSEFRWKVEVDPTAAASGAIDVFPPTVDGIAPLPGITLPTRITVAPAGTIALPPGQDLVFEVERPAYTLESIRWSILLQNAAAGEPFLLILEGAGSWPPIQGGAQQQGDAESSDGVAFPAEIRIHSDLLPRESFPLRAELRLIADFGGTASEAEPSVLGRSDILLERMIVAAP